MARIMIVDDTAFMRIELKKILEMAGHSVIAEVSSGKKAIIEYAAHKPDLVTMDITMPEVNGVEVVREIMQKHPDAKIIMISAITEKSIITTAIKLGAKNYILKPFSSDKVIQTINQVLGTNNKLPEELDD